MHTLLQRNTWKIFSIAVLFAVFTLTACQKEVHISLKGSPPALVVDGSIETGLPPVVVLSTSLSFFSQIDLSSLESSFVHGANVQVSNGSQTVTLKEYSIDSGSNKYSFYTIDTANLSTAMTGQNGTTYTLTIQYNGQTYTSTTKIPWPTRVDSMYLGIPSFTNNIPADARQLFVDYTDPDTLGDYVRYFTSRNSDPYFPGDNVFSDELINGTTIKQIELMVGHVDTAEASGPDTLRYVYPGDTIHLKWCTIDKGVYTFWNSASYASSSVGNPFATPVNVQSNISNGALGVWAGYATYFRTLVAPH